MNFFLLCILLGRCHFNTHIQQLMYVSNSNFFFYFSFTRKNFFFWLHIVLLLTNEQIYSKKKHFTFGENDKKRNCGERSAVECVLYQLFPKSTKAYKIDCYLLHSLSECLWCKHISILNEWIIFFLFFVIIALIRFYFILTCHITRIHLRKDEITLHTNIQSH